MQTTLAAEARDSKTGKGVARKLRASGKLPAVVYAGGDHARAITVDPKALLEIFRKTQNRNTIITLEIDGEEIPTLVKDAQRHPLSRDLLHADFYALEPGQVVEVRVPLATRGRAAGMALGGRLRLIRREVRVRCAWEKIPSVIEHDITPMEVNDMVRASELELPEGVELVIKNDFNVMTIYGKRAPVTPAAVE